jgi:nitrite reductase/ring-hydroxylating ferredoxin subunit
MVLNLTVVAIYILNLGIRYPTPDALSTPPLPFWLSVAGIVLLSISGYLGGAMVYDDGIGVGRHRRRGSTPERTVTVSPTGSADELVRVAREDAIGDGATLRVEVHGQTLCLTKSDGRFYAVQEFCTHRYGPLSEGALCQNTVECPWHRSVFDIRTGRVVKGPAKVNLKVFRVEVRQGDVYVSPRPGSPHHAEQQDIAA